MLHARRPAALVVGALLTASLLTGCGFDAATNKINQITPGTTDRDAEVDVVNTLVVAEAAGSGTLVGQLANNDDEKIIRLLSVTGEGLAATGLERLPVPAGGSAQLSDSGIRISGEFTAGDFITLTLGFSNDDEVELDIPVVPACDEFEGLDDAPNAAATPMEGQPEADPEALESPSDELDHEPGATFDCEWPEPPSAEH